MYLTYAEYQNYGGDLEETVFTNLSFRAEGIINRYTYNRFKNDAEFPEELKRLVFRIINLLILADSALGINSDGAIVGKGPVNSQSNDGLSTSYNNLTASELYKLTGGSDGVAIRNTIKDYLSGVKNQSGKLVLYKGLYEDE